MVQPLQLLPATAGAPLGTEASVSRPVSRTTSDPRAHASLSRIGPARLLFARPQATKGQVSNPTRSTDKQQPALLEGASQLRTSALKTGPRRGRGDFSRGPASPLPLPPICAVSPVTGPFCPPPPGPHTLTAAPGGQGAPGRCAPCQCEESWGPTCLRALPSLWPRPWEGALPPVCPARAVLLAPVTVDRPRDRPGAGDSHPTVGESISQAHTAFLSKRRDHLPPPLTRPVLQPGLGPQGTFLPTVQGPWSGVRREEERLLWPQTSHRILPGTWASAAAVGRPCRTRVRRGH